MSDHRPDKPLTAYPDAALPAAPPAGAEGEQPTKQTAASPAARAIAASPAEPAVVLRFLDPASVSVEVPLRFPFAWEGREIRSITVRRLSVAEVGEIVRAVQGGDLDLLAFHAAMIGLPRAVLRAMPDEDGSEVIAACDPFLSPAARTLLEAFEAATGGGSPSPAPVAAASP